MTSSNNQIFNFSLSIETEEVPQGGNIEQDFVGEYNSPTLESLFSASFLELVNSIDDSRLPFGEHGEHSDQIEQSDNGDNGENGENGKNNYESLLLQNDIPKFEYPMIVFYRPNENANKVVFSDMVISDKDLSPSSRHSSRRSSRRSPSVDFNNIQDRVRKHNLSLDKTGYVGSYSPKDRVARVDKFKAKKCHRVWDIKIKYRVRKNFADSRLRVKGRFVNKKEEMEYNARNILISNM